MVSIMQFGLLNEVALFVVAAKSLIFVHHETTHKLRRGLNFLLACVLINRGREEKLIV